MQVRIIEETMSAREGVDAGGKRWAVSKLEGGAMSEQQPTSEGRR